MKIAAVYCIYNEEEYIEYSIRSIYDFVEKVIICLGKSPYIAYNRRAREIAKKQDKTEDIIRRLAKNDEKFQIFDGIWDSQIEHRNTGLKYCFDNNFDYYFLVDADEVYRKDHLAEIAKEIAAHPEVGTFAIKCAIFWRSFRYRITAENVDWTPYRIFKITADCCFIGDNETNSSDKIYLINPNRAIFYHFSCARSSKSMKEKLLTFTHAHQIPDGWYENIWLKWPQNGQMTNVHPTEPEKFPKIDYVELDDLPEIMKTHPYYKIEIIE